MGCKYRHLDLRAWESAYRSKMLCSDVNIGAGISNSGTSASVSYLCTATTLPGTAACCQSYANADLH